MDSSAVTGAAGATVEPWFNFGGKKQLILCHYCRRNISGTLRMRCVHPDCCKAGTVTESCADCFCVGATLLPHRSDHAYRVVDCIEFPVFSKDWMASEELLLLEAIDRHGVGNWKAISEYIGTKTLKQCEEHYWDSYLGVCGSCLPSKTLVDDQLVDTEAELMPGQRDSIEMGFTVLPPNTKIGDSVNRDKFKDATRGGKKEQDLREKISQLPGADLPGFMPLRQDFEVEHENSAELILADMEFSPDDHPSETALKLDVVKIYNQKLDERDRRKRFVIESGLVDVKKAQQSDRRRTKEDRDLVSRCRLFARFQTPGQQETLISSILLAKRLKKQISLFADYRKLGIRTLDEAREYEMKRRRREQEIRLKRSKQGIDYLPSGASELLNPPGGGLSRTKSGSGNVLSVAAVANDGVSDMSAAVRALQRDAPEGGSLAIEELELCHKLGILPKHYLALQTILVREAFQNGTLSRESVDRLVNMNDENKGLICDFFVRSLRDNFPEVTLSQMEGVEFPVPNHDELSNRVDIPLAAAETGDLSVTITGVKRDREDCC